MVRHTDEQRERGSAPVVFVPGFGPANQSWELLRRHLARAGLDDAGIATRPDTTDLLGAADDLAHRVQQLVELSGAEHVHLVAHSIGGLVARCYVQLLGGDARVASLVMVGTPHGGSRRLPRDLGPVAAQARPGSPLITQLASDTRSLRTSFVNYYADDDLFLDRPQQAVLTLPGIPVVNVAAPGYSHLSVVLPGSLCRSIADQVAAAEGRPGHGRPVTAISGRLAAIPGHDGDADAARRVAIAAARSAHPSSYRPDMATERPAFIGLHAV